VLKYVLIEIDDKPPRVFRWLLKSVECRVAVDHSCKVVSGLDGSATSGVGDGNCGLAGGASG